MEQNNQNRFDYKLLGRVLKLAKPYKKVFATAGFLAVVLAPLSTLRPYLVQVMVDDHIFNYDLSGLQTMAFIFIGVLILESICRYSFIYSSNFSIFVKL